MAQQPPQAVEPSAHCVGAAPPKHFTSQASGDAQSTMQVPVHSTSQREKLWHVMTLSLPARTPQRSMSWQSKRQRSPQMAPQATALWHTTSQSSPQLVLHSCTSKHSEVQASSHTAPQCSIWKQRG
jgi:hypothetical protein